MTDVSWSDGKTVTQFSSAGILISNELDSWPGWKDSLQCDTETKRQVGLHIVVRQATSRGSQGILEYFPRSRTCYIKSSRATTCARHGPNTVPGQWRVAGFSSRAANTMRVGRHFGCQQRNELTTTRLAEIVQRQSLPLSRMHWGAALQIRKRKG